MYIINPQRAGPEAIAGAWEVGPGPRLRGTPRRGEAILNLEPKAPGDRVRLCAKVREPYLA